MPTVDHLLVHRVEVHRRSGRFDRFNQPVDVNPRQHTAGEEVATYPCRAYQKSGGLTMLERSIDVFERVWTMYTGLDVDIREDDALRIFDPGTGREMVSLAKVYSSEVKYDFQGPHHLEFTVWEQSGPK